MGEKVGREIVDQWKRGSFFRLADRVYVLFVYDVIIFILFHKYEFIHLFRLILVKILKIIATMKESPIY